MNLESRREEINLELEKFFSKQEVQRNEVEKIFARIPEFILRGGRGLGLPFF